MLQGVLKEDRGRESTVENHEVLDGGKSYRSTGRWIADQEFNIGQER